MTTTGSYLFVTFEGGGNVPPVLGLARRLVQRGHRVRVLTEPCLQRAVEQIGAGFIPFTEHFTRTDRDAVFMRDWEAHSPPGAIKRSLRDLMLGPAGIVARETEQALDAEPTDALVVDWLMPGAILAGEARSLPTAVLLHCTNMLPGPGKPAPGFPPARGRLGRLRDRIVKALMIRTADAWLPSVNALREERGLSPLLHVFDLYDRADRVLVQSCEAFDFPITPAPTHLAYVGPVLDEPDRIATVDWVNPWDDDDPRPLVVVSLSSTYQNQRATLQAAVSALGRLDVRGFVTLGPAMANESFDAPDNVVLVDAAPHGAVFPHADLLVTHSGHGSVMRALAHDLPLVTLPMGRDQDDNAVRVVARGLGLKPKRSPRAIADAIETVLETPSYRQAARRMGAIVRADAADDRGTAALEALARPVHHPADPVPAGVH